MATVRAGIRRVNAGVEAAPDEPARYGIYVDWVEINGTRLNSADHDLISIDWHADGKGVHEVTIRFASGDFSTVDRRTDGAG